MKKLPFGGQAKQKSHRFPQLGIPFLCSAQQFSAVLTLNDIF